MSTYMARMFIPIMSMKTRILYVGIRGDDHRHAAGILHLSCQQDNINGLAMMWQGAAGIPHQSCQMDNINGLAAMLQVAVGIPYPS